MRIIVNTFFIDIFTVGKVSNTNTHKIKANIYAQLKVFTALYKDKKEYFLKWAAYLSESLASKY